MALHSIALPPGLTETIPEFGIEVVRICICTRDDIPAVPLSHHLLPACVFPSIHTYIIPASPDPYPGSPTPSSAAHSKLQNTMSTLKTDTVTTQPAPQSINAGFASSNHAGHSTSTTEPLVVAPVERGDLQKSYATELGPRSDDAGDGFYGNFIDWMGTIIGTLGAIPCCPCPNPYKEVNQGRYLLPSTASGKGAGEMSNGDSLTLARPR